MPIEPRLIVTGHSPDGDAIFVEDRHPEPVNVQALPGADFYLLWGTPDGGAIVGAAANLPGRCAPPLRREPATHPRPR